MNECPGLVNIGHHENQSTFCEESWLSRALRQRCGFCDYVLQRGEGGIKYLCISAYFYSGTKCLLVAFSFHLDFCLTHNFVFSMIFTCYWPTRLCSISWAFFILIFCTSNCFTIYLPRSNDPVNPSHLPSSVRGTKFELASLSDAHFLSSLLLMGRSRGLPNWEFEWGTFSYKDCVLVHKWDLSQWLGKSEPVL